VAEQSDLGRTTDRWGLQKLGINVAKSTVETHRVRCRYPPSPTWKAFLQNHVKDLASIDFFVVPTVTHKVLLVLVILVHERRRIVHCHVTEHPSAACGRSQRWVACTIITKESGREQVSSKFHVFSCCGISGPTLVIRVLDMIISVTYDGTCIGGRL
jgi:hypothetical protein